MYESKAKKERKVKKSTLSMLLPHVAAFNNMPVFHAARLLCWLDMFAFLIYSLMKWQATTSATTTKTIATTTTTTANCYGNAAKHSVGSKMENMFEILQMALFPDFLHHSLICVRIKCFFQYIFEELRDLLSHFRGTLLRTSLGFF